MPVGIKAMPQEYEFQVVQDGIVVASAWSRDRERALAEAAHYAAMYAQDGPVILRIKPDKRKRRTPPQRQGEPR
jgi:hypothetical protein